MKKILLSLFALLAVMGAKADNEYTLGEELTFEQVKDGQTPFILARVSDGQVLVYGTNGNMAAMKSPTEAGNSQNAFYFKVDAIAGNDTYEANLDEARNAEANAFNGEETNDNLYMFRIYKGTPESLSFWGAWGSTEAFISHCGWTANSNNLNGAKFGADVFYNTIWKVAVEEDGISLQSQSIDNKNYLNGNGGPGEKASWKIYSGLVQGDEIKEDPWTCPEGEVDITTLPWVKNANNCDNRLGTTTDATVWGTDAGPGATPLSYVDLTNCSTLKVYGPKGQRARFFINRDEFPGNFQFFADLNEEGVGALDLATVLASQEGAEYIHLNGIKAAQWGAQLRINGVTVIEKPTPAPEVTISAGEDGSYEITSTSETEALYVQLYTEDDLAGASAEDIFMEDVEMMGYGMTEEQWEDWGHYGILAGPQTISVEQLAMFAGEDVVIVAANVGWDGEKITAISNIATEELTVPTVNYTPSVTLNEAGYATYSCSKKAFILNEGVKAYKAAVEGDKIVLTELDGYIPAGNGVLLYGKDMAGQEVSFMAAPFGEAADMEGNALKATTLADNSIATKEANTWALGNSNLFQAYNGEYIANRAYLVYEKPADVKMEIVFATTGIKNVNAAAREGKMLQNNRIVILKNGKKFNVAGQVIK